MTSSIKPKQPADFFLFMGQSNMAVRGIVSSRFPQPAPLCIPGAGYEFRAVSDPTRLYPLSEPFGANENRPEGIWEPGRKSGSLATAFVNAYYTEAHISVIGLSASKGGSAIREWQPGTPFFKDTRRRLQDAFSFFTREEIPLGRKYLLWCQGETDGQFGTNPAEYEQLFLSMWQALSEEGLEHCFLIPIGCYNAQAAPNAPVQDYTPIREAQKHLASSCTFVTNVSDKFAEMLPRGLMQDTYHYFQQAYNEVGTEAGSNAARYRTGLL